MENGIDAGLAGAVKLIQGESIAACSPDVVSFEVDDLLGGKALVPVAFLPTPGGMVAQPMLGALKDGTEFVRARRLASADGPDRRDGTAVHHALSSFIGHTNRFKSESSAVWANAINRQLVAVLDYHPAGAASAARWGKHRGHYACPLSEAWQAWGGDHGLECNQDEFAELLDSRDRELAAGDLPSGAKAPTPAALVSLANNLEVFSTATAKRERDPNTGRVKINFSEEKGVSGSVLPPPAFLVNIPVFQDGSPQLLEVRLRVAVKEGAAEFHVGIHAAGDVLRAAFAKVCDAVSAATGLPIFLGTPE